MSEFDVGPLIESISIRDQVYNRIRNLIVAGRIPRSTRMTENQLAGQFGVSRTPVRDALRMLETEGFLDAVPRSGYEVRTLMPEEMENICEIRKVLENLAVRWAVEKISAEELSQLEENVRASEEEVKKARCGASSRATANSTTSWRMQPVVASFSKSRRSCGDKCSCIALEARPTMSPSSRP